MRKIVTGTRSLALAVALLSAACASRFEPAVVTHARTGDRALFCPALIEAFGPLAACVGRDGRTGTACGERPAVAAQTDRLTDLFADLEPALFMAAGADDADPACRRTALGLLRWRGCRPDPDHLVRLLTTELDRAAEPDGAILAAAAHAGPGIEELLAGAAGRPGLLLPLSRTYDQLPARAKIHAARAIRQRFEDGAEPYRKLLAGLEAALTSLPAEAESDPTAWRIPPPDPADAESLAGTAAVEADLVRVLIANPAILGFEAADTLCLRAAAVAGAETLLPGDPSLMPAIEATGLPVYLEWIDRSVETGFVLRCPDGLALVPTAIMPALLEERCRHLGGDRERFGDLARTLAEGVAGPDLAPFRAWAERRCVSLFLFAAMFSADMRGFLFEGQPVD